MRKPTTADAELLLHLYEIRREPELRHARAWFLSEFKPTSWADIKSRWLSHGEEDRHFRMTVSYWEMVGALVNRGALHAELFFDHTGEDIVTWDRCKSLIADARADMRPNYLHQFETMVLAHVAFRAKGIAAYQAAHQRKQAAASRVGSARPRARRAR
jgi:hypothetical protein